MTFIYFFVMEEEASGADTQRGARGNENVPEIDEAVPCAPSTSGNHPVITLGALNSLLGTV